MQTRCKVFPYAVPSRTHPAPPKNKHFIAFSPSPHPRNKYFAPSPHQPRRASPLPCTVLVQCFTLGNTPKLPSNSMQVLQKPKRDGKILKYYELIISSDLSEPCTIPAPVEKKCFKLYRTHPAGQKTIFMRGDNEKVQYTRKVKTSLTCVSVCRPGARS